MKKFWKSLALLLCLLAGFGFVFTACSNDDDDDNGGSASGGNSAWTGAQTLTAERKAVTAPETAGEIKIGSTTYNTIQAALDAAKAASGAVTITLGKGTYKEDGLTYDGSNDVKISGQGDADYGLDVVIYGAGKDTSSEKGRTTFEITGSGTIILENLTIQSSRAETAGTAQAEVLATDGTGNLIAYNCSFLSGQDTLRTVTKSWFYKCYIEGDVDFLWMEYTNGVVALYEECVIRAIGSRTDGAYYTAPRLGLTSKVGKGLVIYNSTLEAEANKLTKLYLGRNPWSTSYMNDYYEQVAIVGSKLYLADGITLHADVWSSPAHGTADQAYIGFKTDSYFPKSAKGYGTILTDAQVVAEYAGRNNILNRLYDVNKKKFVKDTDANWNIAKIIEDNGWATKVTADSSKDLLDGETENTIKTYDFTAADANGYTEATVSGLAHEAGKVHAQGKGTITIPLTGKAIVSVTGYYSGTGTIKAGSQGEALFNFAAKNNVDVEKQYIVYSANAGSVVITAETKSYIKKVVVEYDDSLTFTPVTNIELTADDDATEVKAKKTLQFTATLTPAAPDATNTDVKWEITTGTAAATIDQTGLLTALSPTADTDVTVKVSSRDENGVSATKTVKVLKPNDSSGTISWAPDGIEAVSLAAINDDTNSIATGSDFSIYWGADETLVATDKLTLAKGRGITVNGVGYSNEGVDVKKDGVIITYKFPITVGAAPITLTKFAYQVAYTKTNNLYGSVSVVQGSETLYTQAEPLKATNGVIGKEELSVKLAANATATVVVTVTAAADITTASNAFIVADAVLDFEKQ